MSASDPIHYLEHFNITANFLLWRQGRVKQFHTRKNLRDPVTHILRLTNETGYELRDPPKP